MRRRQPRLGRTTQPRARRRERGSAAVEFALVVPILLALFFGMLDYGLWFNNALSARQGVREGARQGVVANWGMSGCTQTAPMEQLACKTDSSIGAINGATYTKVVLPSGGWAKGNQLLVCSVVVAKSLTGYTPLPNGGSVRTSVRMSIETVPTTPPTAGAQEGPSTLDWTWCT